MPRLLAPLAALIAEGDAPSPVFPSESPFVAAGQFGAFRAGHRVHFACVADILIHLCLYLPFGHEMGGVENGDKGALVGNPRPLRAMV